MVAPLGPFKFADGLQIDTWLLDQNKDNLYFLDRDKQRTESYTGINGIPTQDRAMTEGMGYICDRTEEHLGTTDVAVIAAAAGHRTARARPAAGHPAGGRAIARPLRCATAGCGQSA